MRAPGEATYARVLPTFWTDPKVKRRLTRDQKHLLLYLFTSPHTNMIGLYYLPLTYAEAEAELPRADIEAWIAGPLSPFVSYDADTEEILVHRAARHQIGEQLDKKDNRSKAVERILRDTHSTTLVAKFVRLYPEWPLHVPAVPRADDDAPPRAPSTSPSEAPSQAPYQGVRQRPQTPWEALAVAVAVAGTHTELDNTTAATTARARIDESIETMIDEVILAANAGMASNRRLQTYEPIPPGHGSRQFVHEWIQAGISKETILEVVGDRSLTFEPGRSKQISSMKYFDAAVRDEHERRIAKVKANGNATRGNNGKHGTDRGGAPAAGAAEAARPGDYDHLG